MDKSDNSLPAKSNGFGGGDEGTIWRGPRVKFSEGVHKLPDRTVFDKEVIATDVMSVVSCFIDRKLLDEKIENPEAPFDLDQMNGEIPEGEWGTGLDGRPKPPWQRQTLLYLLDERDAGEYTFVTQSIGGNVAVRELKAKVRRMRMLKRIEDYYPVVRLKSTPWKTQYGMRTRPDFEVIDWVPLGPKAPLQIETKPAEITAPTKKGKTRPDEMNDEIPF
jgi:hypothetical protein